MDLSVAGIDPHVYSPIETGTHDFTVYVKTGDKKGEGTDATVSIRLFDDNGESTLWYRLDLPFHNDFPRGHLDTYSIPPPPDRFESVVKIELKCSSNAFIEFDWFVDYVKIRDPRRFRCFVFPVHRWIEIGRPFYVQLFDASLPQNDKHPEQRKAELVEKQKLYEYGRDNPGLVVMVKTLPTDEEFSDDHQRELSEFATGTVASLLIVRLINGSEPFDEIDDIKQLFGRGKAIEKPIGMDHWHDDAWFGAQRVMSCNPVNVKRCRLIPKNFGVTADMVEPFLEGKTLTDALEGKKIYISDMKVMEGVQGAGFKVCQPLALFFVNKAGDIMPIAIQLFQAKSPENPVFLPSDNPNLWKLVKMWYNVADSGNHQALSHLGLTHLKAEGVAVCTHRNLSPSHPIFRLLAPHFLNIMAINSKAVNGVLLKEGGIIDTTIAIGVAGVYQLLAMRQRDFRLNVEGHLLNDLKNRGVDDTDALPFYPYRDDALLIWKPLEKYVGDIVGIYYENNEELVDDWELQQWARDMSASFEDGGIGMNGVPGNGKFETKEELIEALTCIIFMCSVQHAAVNFSQYDDYAFTPNYPSHLNGNPPRKKEPKGDEELVAALPTRKKTMKIISIARILSDKFTNSLGDFEVTYLYEPRAKEAATQLRETLVEASTIMAERNKSRKYEYTILDPAFVPNSISI